LVGYTKAQYPDRSESDTSWIVDATLQYELLRNVSLSWEYQHVAIVSDRPGANVDRDLVVVRSSYRF
jgi:hypothetical protein